MNSSIVGFVEVDKLKLLKQCDQYFTDFYNTAHKARAKLISEAMRKKSWLTGKPLYVSEEEAADDLRKDGYDGAWHWAGFKTDEYKNVRKLKVLAEISQTGVVMMTSEVALAFEHTWNIPVLTDVVAP